jgi:hypothetical protein
VIPVAEAGEFKLKFRQISAGAFYGRMKRRSPGNPGFRKVTEVGARGQFLPPIQMYRISVTVYAKDITGMTAVQPELKVFNSDWHTNTPLFYGL